MAGKITLREVKKSQYLYLPGEKGGFSRLRIPQGWLEVAYPTSRGLRWKYAPASHAAVSYAIKIKREVNV